MLNVCLTITQTPMNWMPISIDPLAIAVLLPGLLALCIGIDVLAKDQRTFLD